MGKQALLCSSWDCSVGQLEWGLTWWDFMIRKTLLRSYFRDIIAQWRACFLLQLYMIREKIGNHLNIHKYGASYINHEISIQCNTVQLWKKNENVFCKPIKIFELFWYVKRELLWCDTYCVQEQENKHLFIFLFIFIKKTWKGILESNTSDYWVEVLWVGQVGIDR